MSYKGPRAKLSRRLGVALTRKAALVMTRKPHPPGQHGQRHRRAPSEFARQLLEKQRLKYQYNVSEKQLRKYYTLAARKKGNKAENLVRVLESRLDALVHRSGLAPTMYAARQLVGHGHITVNGKRVDIPSFLVKMGDVVSVREKSKKMLMFQESLQSANPPAYVELNRTDLSCRIARIPEREEIPVICEVPLVVEYYAR